MVVVSKQPRTRPNFCLPFLLVLAAIVAGALFIKHEHIQSLCNTATELTDPTRSRLGGVGGKAPAGRVGIPTVVEDSCSSLPNIRRAGNFLFHAGMKDTVSPPGIEPVYHVASPFLERSQGEIKNDAANFYLINDYVNSLSGKGISFDIGGNRGYYTHFMATLGLEVHAFEIEMNMFDCLRHGTLFNPLDVVERTNLYQIGLSDTVGRFGQQGSGGMGFLVSGANGVTPPIQAITLDCFAWHVKPDLSKVDVVKIDVEGFEIAVLRGAKNSLLHPDVKIGSLLIEVGPDRWERGGVSLDAGMNEMKELAGRFKYAYVIIRERGAYWQTCAPALASKILSNKGGAPVKIKDVNNNAILHWVAMDEWVPLLTEMNVTGSDCNFWFKN